MKQQFRALLLIGLLGSSFNLACTTINSNEGLGSFVQGFVLALAQPLVGCKSLDDDSSTYLYEETNSSSFKNGATAGLITVSAALCAVLCKLAHEYVTEKATCL
jgi:hypothetical protein